MEANNIAGYILEEKDLTQKQLIIYKLAQRIGMTYDKSILFKSEILDLYSKIQNMSDNEINTLQSAMLLCNCKRGSDPQNKGDLETYAKNGAEFLKTLGFDDNFCKICEGVNRYSGLEPRPEESDTLEVIDKFGGMVLDRPERTGYKPEDALILLEERNLKGVYNRDLESFKQFVHEMENVQIQETVSVPAIERLVKLWRDTEGTNNFIVKTHYDYRPKVENALEEYFGRKGINNSKESSKIETSPEKKYSELPKEKTQQTQPTKEWKTQYEYKELSNEPNNGRKQVIPMFTKKTQEKILGNPTKEEVRD